MTNTLEYIEKVYCISQLGHHEASQYTDAIRKYGSIEEAYEHVNDKNLKERCHADIMRALEMNINVVCCEDEAYPETLLQYKNYPLVLFYYGDISRLNTFDYNLGVVGSRACSIAGRDITDVLVSGLYGRNVSIISGLARGIDGVAHRSALENDIFTCAVLASGVDYIYPIENKSIYYDIKEKGVIISEMPPNTIPMKQFFPARNRIIAGLSNGILLTEAGKKSGALITTDLALDAGRDIFVVPQSIDSVLGIGCNEILKRGGTCITEVSDLLLGMNFNVEECNEKQYDLSVLNKSQKTVFSIIAYARGLNEDEIIDRTMLSAGIVKQSLAYLELIGYARRRADGSYVKG